MRVSSIAIERRLASISFALRCDRNHCARWLLQALELKPQTASRNLGPFAKLSSAAAMLRIEEFEAIVAWADARARDFGRVLHTSASKHRTMRSEASVQCGRHRCPQCQAKIDAIVCSAVIRCLDDMPVPQPSGTITWLALVASAVTSLPHQAFTDLLCRNRNAMAETIVGGASWVHLPAAIALLYFGRGSRVLRVLCFFSWLQNPELFSAHHPEAGRYRCATRGRQVVVGGSRTVPTARTFVL